MKYRIILSFIPISTVVLRWVITDVDVASNLVVRFIVLLEAVHDGFVSKVQVQWLGEVQEYVLCRQQVHQLRALRWTKYCHAFICGFVRLESKGLDDIK